MKFELRPSILGDRDIPDLVIPVAEIIRADDTESGYEALTMLRRIINIYTYYCGKCKTLLDRDFKDLISQLGKTGELVITCFEPGTDPQFLFRVISNGEKRVDAKLTEIARGYINA